MHKTLRELAFESHLEARDQIETSIYRGLFAFRGQKLLKENELLLKQGRYQEVIDNSDRIRAIVDREHDTSMIDETFIYLDWIENLIITGNDNGVDVNVLKQRVLDLEEIFQKGNIYLATSKLLAIVNDHRSLQQEYFYDWSRHITMEMSERMDGLLALYNEFPKHFFDFHENPIHALTSYIEDVLTAVAQEEFKELEEDVRKFYLLYFQVDRFLSEEKAEVTSMVPQADPQDRIKDLLKKLKEIKEGDAGVRLGPVLQETVNGFEETERQQLRWASEEKCEFEYEEIPEVVEALPDEVLGHDFSDLPQLEQPDELPTLENQKRRLSIEIADVLDSMDQKEKKTLTVKEVPGTHRIKSLVKRKAKKTNKILPQYQSYEDQKQDRLECDERVQVVRKAKKAKKPEREHVIESPVELIEQGDGDNHEEIDINQLLARLDCLAFKAYINKNYNKAIEYYDQIIIIDPKYKDAYQKRDDCYMHVYNDLKSDFTRVIRKKKKAKKA